MVAPRTISFRLEVSARTFGRDADSGSIYKNNVQSVLCVCPIYYGASLYVCFGVVLAACWSSRSPSHIRGISVFIRRRNHRTVLGFDRRVRLPATKPVLEVQEGCVHEILLVLRWKINICSLQSLTPTMVQGLEENMDSAVRVYRASCAGVWLSQPRRLVSTF